MKQEDKDLLLCDLCERLPYGVKGKTLGGKVCTLRYIGIDGDFTADLYHGWLGKGQFIPYLRPMSSMTEEEYKELKSISSYYGFTPYEFIYDWSPNYDVIDWLNKHMFDYRGLIPKGLAISTDKFNPYKDFKL